MSNLIGMREQPLEFDPEDQLGLRIDSPNWSILRIAAYPSPAHNCRRPWDVVVDLFSWPDELPLKHGLGVSLLLLDIL